MTNYLVLVPLPEEMEVVHSTLSENGALSLQAFDSSIDQYAFKFRAGAVKDCSIDARVLGDMGNLRAAAGMTKFVLDGSYDFIFLIGLAGSVAHNDLGLGDVILSNRVKSMYPDKVARLKANEKFASAATWHSVKESGDHPIDERKKILEDSYLRYRRDAIVWGDSARSITDYLAFTRSEIGREIFDKLKSVTSETFPDVPDLRSNTPKQVHYGTVFSSEMVIDSMPYFQFLRDRDNDETRDVYFRKFGKLEHSRRSWFSGDIMAVDMESYGFFSMARKLSSELRNARCLTIRGISDLASLKSDLDESSEEGVRKIAVENCAQILMHFIRYNESIVVGRR